MYTVIFNYNLPEETMDIYNKLISDGFKKEKIIVVDNGSDKRPPPIATNFMLPENIRFTGQSFMALSYLLNFFEFEYLLLISTSARLHPDRNYLKDVTNAVNFAKKNKAGFITSSLTGGNTDFQKEEQHKNIIKKDFTPVFGYQPIATIVSRNLLELCQRKKAAYFNLSLKRGWGIDRELQYIANKNNMTCYVSKNFVVEWKTSINYKKNMASESVDDYRQHAYKEMNIEFHRKYGRFWKKKFKIFFRLSKRKTIFD